MDYGNGQRLTARYSHHRHHMNGLKVEKTDGSNDAYDLGYDYYNGGGSNGRIQKVTDGIEGSYTTTYGYDAANRLKTASGAGESGSYSLSYAANGSGAPPTNRINNSGYSFDRAGNIKNYDSLCLQAVAGCASAGKIIAGMYT